MNQLVAINPQTNVEAYRASTDAAAMCKEIVVNTATTIQGRKYVCVEGWQAIAIAHGCTAGARDVERVDGGVRAIGEVRRMADGTVIATAEGFVGEDEPTWYGGSARGKTLPKRADYAIRAMAQTRAISRACRSAFAHVVVMMNAGLATTPAEEVPFGGFDHDTGEAIEAQPAQHSGPAPRTKLAGPFSSKTALKKAIHEIHGKVAVASSTDEVDGILKSALPTIRQAEHDWPELLNGDPAIPEDTGLKGAVALRREQLTAPAEEGMYSMLIDSMKQCDTRSMLTGWMTANEPVIDALDDADRRRFEAEYDKHEAGIGAMDRVTAGA